MHNLWELVHLDHPWLQNAERAGGNRGIGGARGRAALTKTWRDTFARLCQIEKVPALQWVVIEARQHCPSHPADPGAIYPAVKAAVDGLVDAGVIPDDTGEFVHALTFRPAIIVNHHALALRVSGDPCGGDEIAAREHAHRQRLLRRLGR